MFQQSLLSTSRAAAASRRRSTFLAVTFQMMLVAAGVIIPRMYIEALPLHSDAPPIPVFHVSPSSNPDRAHSGGGVPQHGPVIPLNPTAPCITCNHEQANAATANDQPDLNSAGGCIVGCVSSRVDLGDPGSARVAIATPTPQIIVRKSNLDPGMLLYKPQPVYPRMAWIARTEGTVLLHAIISTDGHISELQVVNGPAMLQQAALEAVSQWRYKPYILSGHPVAVETQIQVKFTLR